MGEWVISLESSGFRNDRVYLARRKCWIHALVEKDSGEHLTA